MKDLFELMVIGNVLSIRIKTGLTNNLKVIRFLNYAVKCALYSEELELNRYL